MDVFFLMSTFRFYPALKMSFERKSGHKNLSLSACSVGKLEFLYVRWTES